MKLIYNDVPIADIRACSDFDEGLYSKVYFILYALSANHYNLNGTPHSKLFEMALEDAGQKDAETPSLEALVELAENQDVVRTFCEYIIADMAVLIKPGVMSGTNMYFQKVRAAVRGEDGASAKRQKSETGDAVERSSMPRWKFINAAYISQTYRVQMRLTPAKESRIVENTIDKINNASYLFAPVADVLALVGRDEVAKHTPEAIYGHIAEMNIVTFEQFRYFGCKGGLSNPTAAPSHTNPIVMCNPMPLVFVAKLTFDCAKMVRIYKPKDGEAPAAKKGSESGSGSESLLISPVISEERLDDLNEYFSNVPNSSVSHIFKTGRDGWNPHDPKAFINIDKDCKLYIPSGLNRKVRGMKPKEYKLPAAVDIVSEFSPQQVNNNFFEFFSAYEESAYLQKNQFEETEIGEKTRLMSEIVKEQKEITEVSLTLKEQSICSFIGTPRHFLMRNLAKDFNTIESAKSIVWKSAILTNYQNFNDNIYFSCSTDEEKKQALAKYYKEASTTKTLMDGISRCVSLRRYYDYNEPVFNELEGKLVRVLIIARPRSLSAKMKLVVEAIIPFALESGDDDPNQAARSNLMSYTQ